MAASNSNGLSERKTEAKTNDARFDLIRVRLHSTLAVPAAYITFQDNKQSALAWKKQAVLKLNQKFQCELNSEDCVLVDASAGVIPDHIELNGSDIRLLTLMQTRSRISAVAENAGAGLTVPYPDISGDSSPRPSTEIPQSVARVSPSSPPPTPRLLDPSPLSLESKEDFTAKLGSEFLHRLRNLEDGDALTMQAKNLAANSPVLKGGYMTRRYGFQKKRRYCAIFGSRLVVCRMKVVEFSVELILSLDGAMLKVIDSKEDKDMMFRLQTSDKKEFTFIAPDADWYQQLDKIAMDRSWSSMRSTKSQIVAMLPTGFDALEAEVLNWLQSHDMADVFERQLSKVTSIVLLLMELDGKQAIASSVDLLREALAGFTPPPGLQALVGWKWETNGEEGLQALLETLNKNANHKLTLEELKPLWARARMRLDPSLAVPISHMSFNSTKRQSVRAWKSETVAKLNAKFQGNLDASECNLVDANSKALADSVDLSGLDLYGLTLVNLPKYKSPARGVKSLEAEVISWLDRHELATDLSSCVSKVTSIVLLLLELDAKTVTSEQLHSQLASFAPPLCLKALVEWKPQDEEVVEKAEVAALLEVLNVDAARQLSYEEFKPLLAQLAQPKQDDLVRVRLDESLAVPLAYITCSRKKTQSAKAWKYDIIAKLNAKCTIEIDPLSCLFVNSSNKPLADELELQSADLKTLSLTKMKPEAFLDGDPKVTSSFRLAPKDSAQLAQACRIDIQTMLRKLSVGAWNRLIFYGLDPIVQIEALQHPILPDVDSVTRQTISLHDMLMIVVSSLPGSQKMAQFALDLQALDPALPQPIRQIELLLDLFLNLQDVDLKCRCDYADLDRKSIPAGTNDCLLLIMHSFLSVGGMDCLLENMLSWAGMPAYDSAIEWTIKIIWLLEMTQARHISCDGAIELDLFPTDECWWQDNALSKCVALLEDPPLTVFVALFEIANEKLETFRDRKADYEALVRIQSFRNVRVFNVMELGWKNARFSVLEHCLEYVVCCQSQKKNLRYLLSDPLWYRFFIPLLLNGGAQSSFNINARSINSVEAEAKVEVVLKLAVSACVSVLHGSYLGLDLEDSASTPIDENKPTFSTLLLCFCDGVEEIALWTPDTVMIIRLILQALLTKVSHSLTTFCHDPSSPTWEYFFQLCSVVENFVFYSPIMESPLRSIEERRFTHLGLHGDDDVILVELLLECIVGLKIESVFGGGLDPVVKKLCVKITQRVLEEQEFWKCTIEFLRLVGSLDQKMLEKTKAYKNCETALKQRRSRSKLVKRHAILEAKRIRRALRAPTSSVRKPKDSTDALVQKPQKQTNEQAFWKLHSDALASAQVAREQRAQQFANRTLLSKSRPFPKPQELGGKVQLTERRTNVRRTTVVPSQEELKLEKEILRVRSVRRSSFADPDDETESAWQEVRNRGMSILENRPRGSFSLARRNSIEPRTLEGRPRGLSLLRRNSSTEVSRVLELRARNNSLSSRRNSSSGVLNSSVPPPGILSSVRRSISFPDGEKFSFANFFRSEPPPPFSAHVLSVSLASATVTASLSSSPLRSSPSAPKSPPSPSSLSRSLSASSPLDPDCPPTPSSEPTTPLSSEPSTPTFFSPIRSPRSAAAMSLIPPERKPPRSQTFFGEEEDG